VLQPRNKFYLLSRAAWFVECRWRFAKNNFILKFCLYLREQETALNLLSKYLLMIGFHFDAMLCFTWVTKLPMRAILNVHAGGRTPTPDRNVEYDIRKLSRRISPVNRVRLIMSVHWGFMCHFLTIFDLALPESLIIVQVVLSHFPEILALY